MDINFSEIPLCNLTPGQEAQVRAVVGPGRGLRLRLGSLGIRPGAVVRLISLGAGHGPILLEVDGTRVALGRGLARRILVSPLRPNVPK